MNDFDIVTLDKLSDSQLKEVHKLMYFLMRDQTGTENISIHDDGENGDINIGTHQYVCIDSASSKVVSFACFVYDSNDERHIITISTLVTHPEYRGKGTTKAFVKSCIQTLQEQNTDLKSVSVLVERYVSNDTAGKFYNSLGLYDVFNDMVSMHGTINL